MILVSILTMLEFLLGISLRKLRVIFSFAKKRYIFEEKNSQEMGCKPFRGATAAFHFSSEGEFEQIFGILEHLISENKKVELIFTSPSVEKKVVEFYQKYPHMVRYLRYPFLKNVKLTNWISAKTICLVRYDFFPEMLGLKFENRGKFILLAGNFKKISKSSRIHQYAYRYLMRLFDLIVCNTFQDERILKMNLKFYGQTMVADFRIPRILNRILNADLSCQQKWKDYLPFKNWLSCQNSTMVWGSAWLEDLKALISAPLDKKILETRHIIIPHQLSEKSLFEMMNYLSQFAPTTLYVGETDSWELVAAKAETGILILAVKGILCELYQEFDYAYVGGGFSSSIHSVLEPFLSQTQTACGPLIHRSTEFDQIKDAYRGLDVLTQPQDLAHFLSRKELRAELQIGQENLIKKFTSQNSQVLEILGR